MKEYNFSCPCFLQAFKANSSSSYTRHDDESVSDEGIGERNVEGYVESVVMDIDVSDSTSVISRATPVVEQVQKRFFRRAINRKIQKHWILAFGNRFGISQTTVDDLVGTVSKLFR